MPTEVASVAVRKPDGKILMGRRRDVGKWTLPGGHLEDGEDPQTGACRECMEEVGFTPCPGDLKPLASQLVTKPDGKEFLVHAFETDWIPGAEVTTLNDPDEEMSELAWVQPDADGKLPPDILANLHNHPDVTLVALGLVPPEADEASLERGESFHDIADLQKMALADMQPGHRMASGATDYSHLLDPAHRSTYRLVVRQPYGPVDNEQVSRAHLVRIGTSEDAGRVSGFHQVTPGADGKRRATINASHVTPELRGKGIGKAMYEAWILHAHNQGQTHVAGEDHSTSAGRVHQALATKHGMGYDARSQPPKMDDKPPGAREPDWDLARGPYEYALKAEGSAPEPKVRKPTSSLVAVHNLTAANLKHADELGGLAAPSIAVAHHDMIPSAFGEISLIAHPDMVDPQKGTPTFDADVYSPRYPQASYKISSPRMTKLHKELSPHADATGAYIGDLDDELANAKFDHEYKQHRAWPAFAHAFLATKGIKPEVPMRDKPLRYGETTSSPAMQEFKLKHGVNYDKFNDPESPEGSEYHKALATAFQQGAVQADAKFNEAMGSNDGIPDTVYQEGAKDAMDTNGLVNRGTGYNLLKDLESSGQREVDKGKFHENLMEQMAEHPEFPAWMKSKIDGVRGDRYFKPTNSSRAVPYTLDKLTQHMTKTIRQGEGFNYGMGSTRAAGAMKFHNLEHIRGAAGSIVSKPEMEEHKKKLNESFDALHTDMERYAQFQRSHSSLLDAIGDSMKPGKSLVSALRSHGFTGVPTALMEKVAGFRKMLKESPTEYFEAKPQRSVHLREFKGAVVPHDVDAETMATLKRLGIPTEIYQRNDDASRSAAVRHFAYHQKLNLSEDDWGEGLQKNDPTHQEPRPSPQTITWALKNDPLGAGLNLMNTATIKGFNAAQLKAMMDVVMTQNHEKLFGDEAAAAIRNPHIEANALNFLASEAEKSPMTMKAIFEAPHVPEAVTHSVWQRMKPGSKIAALELPNTSVKMMDELFNDPTQRHQLMPSRIGKALANPNVKAADVKRWLAEPDGIVAEGLSSPYPMAGAYTDAKPEIRDVLWQHGAAEAVKHVLNKDVDPDAGIVGAGTKKMVAELADTLEDSHLHDLAAAGFNPSWASEIHSPLAQRFWESGLKTSDKPAELHVKPDTDRLRGIRDHLEGMPARGAQMRILNAQGHNPQALGLAGRADAKGFLTADGVQKHIDELPARKYVSGHTTWDGMQRHSDNKQDTADARLAWRQSGELLGADHPETKRHGELVKQLESQAGQSVFHVALHPETVKELKSRGLLGAFNKLHDHSKASGHPSVPGSIGWVRYDERPDGIHHDELQTDMGPSTFKALAAEPHFAANQLDVPEADVPKTLSGLHEVLWGKHHPSDVIHEAFQQHLRNTGKGDVRMHMWQLAPKADLSGLDEKKPKPGHFQYTYDQAPKKRWGYKESEYGGLTAQSNPEHAGKPTWEKKMTKFELDLDTWYAAKLTDDARTCDPDQMKLEKSAGKALMGLAAATALHAMGSPAQASIPEWREQVPMTSPDAPQTVGAPRVGTKWHPAGLPTEMHPIAHLESSWGRNVSHDLCPGGDYHTAFGALGFKPVTAHEQYKNSKTLKAAYPGLQDQAAFMERFREDPHFYNTVAGAHFNMLKANLGGDARKAAFGWRWGIGAAQRAAPEEIEDDDYVRQYSALNDRLTTPRRGQMLVAKNELTFDEADEFLR